MTSKLSSAKTSQLSSSNRHLDAYSVFHTPDPPFAGQAKGALVSEEHILVWEVWPHINPAYEYAIFDEKCHATDYAKRVIDHYVGSTDSTLHLKLYRVSMTRREYEELARD